MESTATKKIQIVHDGCMITRSGIIFNLMDPDPDQINLEDIAHGLGNNCRWNGATKRFYSIAEHSIKVADRCIPDYEKRKTGLFHDAEEAYWGDIITPLKRIIEINSPEVLKKMKLLRSMIYEKFRIKDINVDREDSAELEWEYRNLIRDDLYRPLSPEQAIKCWLACAQNFYNKG